jgi:CubicO group peptidase (beta-lactamase class C family)
VNRTDLEHRMQELSRTYDIPGASVAVLADGEVTTAAVGVLNRETQVETTTDSLFQIGSITKTYTASLVMRLVERGVLDLDVPIRTYLPEFRVADEAASASVTLRHLLTHSSGIDGDHFLDTGRGDDVLEKYVASCAHLAQQFPVGATMSYCNAGFGIVGRVIEKVTNKVWDRVLRDELLDPLELRRTVTLPEEVLRYRAACGHVGEPGSLRLTPQWGIPRSSGPAGLINATASDVAAFAQAFLRDGRAPNGTSWLAESTTATMLEPQVAVPEPYSTGTHWGLGWILHEQQPRLVYGHDGATLGQNASLQVVPDRGVAVAVLRNGGGTGDFSHTLLAEVLQDVAGLTVRSRPQPVPGATGGDRSAQVGVYRRAGTTMRFEESPEQPDAGLRLTVTDTSDLADVVGNGPTVLELSPVADDVYVGRLPGSDEWTPVVFFSLDDGSRFVHLEARATPRVETAGAG